MHLLEIQSEGQEGDANGDRHRGVGGEPRDCVIHGLVLLMVDRASR